MTLSIKPRLVNKYHSSTLVSYMKFQRVSSIENQELSGGPGVEDNFKVEFY